MRLFDLTEMSVVENGLCLSRSLANCKGIANIKYSIIDKIT
jgi:hypothetical protein